MTRKSYAKVNVFLKILGKEGGYHQLASRFILVKNLYDTLSFQPKTTPAPFELHGEFGCPLSDNTIYKAYTALADAGYKKEIEELMAKYALHVDKKIPSFGGLGGGSSNAGIFLWMLNEEASLGIDTAALARIGTKVGADVPFFVYGFESANVYGIGDIVEKFEEEPLHVKIKMPNVACDTKAVYDAYEEFYNPDAKLARKMEAMDSHELLSEFSDMELNDLLAPALKLYPALEYERDHGWFFSGSGSSFFQEIKYG